MQVCTSSKSYFHSMVQHSSSVKNTTVKTAGNKTVLCALLAMAVKVKQVLNAALHHTSLIPWQIHPAAFQCFTQKTVKHATCTWAPFNSRMT